MNFGKSLLVLSALTISAFAGAQTHLTKAQSLVNSLRTQGNNGAFTDASGDLNRYGAAYADVVMVWGPTAKVNAVCANFVTVLLMKSYTWTAKSAGFTTASPNPAQYHDAIETSSKGFTQVSQFENVLPGDLLMVKYNDDAGNFGHAMIVEDAALADEDLDTHVKTWSVKVIDCSKDTHTNDSRVFASRTTQGAGRGTIRVVTKNGAILGYSWSITSALYDPTVRHMVVGRLNK